MTKKLSHLQELPRRQPTVRVITSLADTNSYGVGGWLLGQMDLAASSVAIQLPEGRAVSRSVENAKFYGTVTVGDEVSIYAAVEKNGQTSIRITVDVWCRDLKDGMAVQVANAVFAYVAIDSYGSLRNDMSSRSELHYVLGGDRD